MPCVSRSHPTARTALRVLVRVAVAVVVLHIPDVRNALNDHATVRSRIDADRNVETFREDGDLFRAPVPSSSSKIRSESRAALYR